MKINLQKLPTLLQSEYMDVVFSTFTSAHKHTHRHSPLLMFISLLSEWTFSMLTTGWSSGEMTHPQQHICLLSSSNIRTCHPPHSNCYCPYESLESHYRNFFQTHNLLWCETSPLLTSPQCTAAHIVYHQINLILQGLNWTIWKFGAPFTDQAVFGHHLYMWCQTYWKWQPCGDYHHLNTNNTWLLFPHSAYRELLSSVNWVLSFLLGQTHPQTRNY